MNLDHVDNLKNVGGSTVRAFEELDDEFIGLVSSERGSVKLGKRGHIHTLEYVGVDPRDVFVHPTKPCMFSRISDEGVYFTIGATHYLIQAGNMRTGTR